MERKKYKGKQFSLIKIMIFPKKFFESSLSSDVKQREESSSRSEGVGGIREGMRGALFLKRLSA